MFTPPPCTQWVPDCLQATGPLLRDQVRTWLSPAAEPVCARVRGHVGHGHASACVCICAYMCLRVYVCTHVGVCACTWCLIERGLVTGIGSCGVGASDLSSGPPVYPHRVTQLRMPSPPWGVQAVVTCLCLVLKCFPCSECGNPLPPRSSSVVFSSGRSPRPPDPHAVLGVCVSCAHQQWPPLLLRWGVGREGWLRVGLALMAAPRGQAALEPLGAGYSSCRLSCEGCGVHPTSPWWSWGHQ